MTSAIPVIDLPAAEAGERAQLAAVRAATEGLGALQVVNHGVPQDLIAALSTRMATPAPSWSGITSRTGWRATSPSTAVRSR
jgi:hypothetical protein